MTIERPNGCFVERGRRFCRPCLSAVWLLLLAVTLWPPAQAMAYRARMTADCTHFLHWPAGQEVSYWLNQRGCGDISFERCEAAVKAAFETVQNIPCVGVTFKYEGPTDVEEHRHSPPESRDNKNVVIWYEDWPPDPSISDTAVSTIWGLTNSETGEFVEFGIALNGETYPWSDDLSEGTHDVQGVLTTQALYALGLWRTDEPVQTILDGVYRVASDEKRTPQEDDIAGACFLAPQNPEPEHWDTSCPPDQHCEGAECVPGAPPDAGRPTDSGRPDARGPDASQTADARGTPAQDAGRPPTHEGGARGPRDADQLADAAGIPDASHGPPQADSGRLAECQFNADCEGDDICTDGQCVSPAQGQGGCDCTVAPSSSESFALSLAFLLALCFAARRFVPKTGNRNDSG